MPRVDLRPIVRLRRALLDAFPDRAALQEMLYFRLNWRLNEIVAESKNLRHTVLAVIQYADNRGRLRDLVEAAQDARPENPLFRELADALPPASVVGRLRRHARRRRRTTYFLMVAAGAAFALLVPLAFSGRLEERQLDILKAVLGVVALLLVYAGQRSLGFRIEKFAEIAAPFITLAAALMSPVDAGLVTMTGRVLYERSGEPVPDVQIVVPGAPHHRSLPTRADGYFVITGVPADTTELIAEWPGGDGRRFRVNADGADYAVIPRPVEEVETARTAIPPGSWRSAQSVSCQAPLAGFVLSTLIPPSPTAARTRVQVDLSDGASFVRAITHHPQGFALDPTANPQVHKRWEFTTASGVDPHIEVCLNSATGEPLAPAVLHASYWYVEIR